MVDKWYGRDLAYIHDVGFSDFALGAAPGILKILKRGGIGSGLVVDLGCGSGVWAYELSRAGYRVLGIDLSESMIALARKRAPQAEFRIGSLFDSELPRCDAVTALGECLSYLFDSNSPRRLARLFGQIYRSLVPGGLFIFDIVESGRLAGAGKAMNGRVGDDWVVLAEKEEDAKRRVLTRRITTFRREGDRYVRADETHKQRLYAAAEISKLLRAAGFKVRTIRSYGHYPLLDGRAAFIARKPKAA